LWGWGGKKRGYAFHAYEECWASLKPLMKFRYQWGAKKGGRGNVTFKSGRWAWPPGQRLKDDQRRKKRGEKRSLLRALGHNGEGTGRTFLPWVERMKTKSRRSGKGSNSSMGGRKPEGVE